MYSDLPFLVSIAFIALGLWVLAWSANRFVDASGALAVNLGVPPFIIGMVVIGFGTSAPELAVSAISKGVLWVASFLIYLAILIFQECV